MNKLEDILKNKSINKETKRAIIVLYEPAVKFWGEDKRELILKTIEDFEIFNVDNLGNVLVDSQKEINTQKGVSLNTKGLCMIIPLIQSGSIVGTRKVIFLENNKNEKEIASLLAHELFFHGVKSMIQSKLKENILMTGLSEGKYSLDKEDNIISVRSDNNFALEELTTYYGQNKLIKEVYNEEINVDPYLLYIANILGEIIETTSFGKILLESQITKDTSKLENQFEEIEEKRAMFTNDSNKLSWDTYNEVMDKFISLFYKINNLSENDSSYQEVFTEYKNIFNQLNNITTQILFVSTILTDEETYKKKLTKK